MKTTKMTKSATEIIKADSYVVRVIYGVIEMHDTENM